MKKLILLVALSLGVISTHGQSCVKIESILVDACTISNSCGGSSAPACSCEGKNEMFRFRVGNVAKDVNDLIINWPNNGFQGICQNSQTASNTAQLNETIEACGWLLEPENNILPANSQVLVVSSTDMCLESNSFAGLSDTLYIIYQCPGNYYGHFANHGSGFRTTTISFGGGCTSSASYNRAMLVSETGENVAADGATVDFPVGGAPVYYNNGCNAPIPAENVAAGDDTEICPGSPVELSGLLEGNFSEWYWSGGSGNFDNPEALNTTYTPGIDESNVTLTLNAVNCNGVVSDDIQITILFETLPVISPAGPLSLCPGETIDLEVSGEGDLLWSTGETTSEITVTTPGIYTATVTGECGPQEVSVEVTASTDAELNVFPAAEVLICEGESVELSATGNGTFVWSTGSEDASIVVNAAGEYTVELTNGCGIFEESIVVSTQDSPTVSLVSPTEIALCEGAEAELEASGTGNFLWSTGDASASTTINQTGNYSVWLSNSCGTDSASVNVVDGGNLPEASIEVIGNSAICAGEGTVLSATSDGDFVWNTGAITSTIEVFEPGVYSITAINECGSSEASVSITQNTIPVITITPESAVICHGNPVSITGVSNLSIQWHSGGTGTSKTYSSAGNYYAYVSNNCGSDTAFFNITEGNPLALFQPTPDTGSAPLEVTFINSSSDASEYHWYINGSSKGTDADLETIFQKPGNFEVELIASDSAGCSDSYVMNYHVGGCEDAILYIPNSFTPNGDGVNDHFRFVADCVQDYEMNIYNRYGVLVYSGRKGEPFWNGDDGSGYYVSDGVYVYSLTYQKADGFNGKTSGSITIFR